MIINIIKKLSAEGVFSPGKYYPITNIKLNKNEISLKPKGTELLKATINPENTTDSPNITWSSSDESIAKVDEKGKVTAIAVGKTEITAKSKNGKEDKCIVLVDDNVPETTYKKGDVNGDGKVTLIDYGLVLAHVKRTKLLTGEELQRADVNEDKKVTLIDYGLILAHVKRTKLLF